MPAPIRELWKNKLASDKANDPSLGAFRLHKGLNEYAKREGLTDVPSERWIGKWLRKDWPKLEGEGGVSEYLCFDWPDSMVRKDIPWEASGAALELLRESLKLLGISWRPSNRAVSWFWHVTQAVPTAEFETRLSLTSVLLVAKSLEKKDWTEAVKWCLAFQPWVSDADAKSYEQALLEAELPEIPEVLRFDSSAVRPEDLEFLTLVNIAYKRQKDREANNA